MTEESVAKHKHSSTLRRPSPELRTDLRARRLLSVPQDEGVRDVRKPGPILTNSIQLSWDLVKTGSENPAAVKPTHDAEVLLNSTTAGPSTRSERGRDHAIASYLFATREARVRGEDAPRGDPKNGEKIVKEVDAGCHVVGEGSRSDAGPRRTFDSRRDIGNKTSYEWIFNGCAIRPKQTAGHVYAHLGHGSAGGRRRTYLVG